MKLVFLFILSIFLGSYYLTYEPQRENYTPYAKSVARRLIILKRAATDWVRHESEIYDLLNLSQALAHFCGLGVETQSPSFGKYLRLEDCQLAGYRDGVYKDHEIYAKISDHDLTVMTAEALCAHNLVYAVYQEAKRLSKSPLTLSITHEPNQYSTCGQVKFQLKTKE